jgi:hypothetical protein
MCQGMTRGMAWGRAWGMAWGRAWGMAWGRAWGMELRLLASTFHQDNLIVVACSAP